MISGLALRQQMGKHPMSNAIFTKDARFSSYVLMEFSLSFQAKHFDIMDVFQNFEPRASNEIASD